MSLILFALAATSWPSDWLTSDLEKMDRVSWSDFEQVVRIPLRNKDWVVFFSAYGWCPNCEQQSKENLAWAASREAQDYNVLFVNMDDVLLGTDPLVFDQKKVETLVKWGCSSEQTSIAAWTCVSVIRNGNEFASLHGLRSSSEISYHVRNPTFTKHEWLSYDEQMMRVSLENAKKLVNIPLYQKDWVVFFSAIGFCPNCVRMAPIYLEWAKSEQAKDYNVIFVNYDEVLVAIEPEIKLDEEMMATVTKLGCASTDTTLPWTCAVVFHSSPGMEGCFTPGLSGDVTTKQIGDYVTSSKKSARCFPAVA